MVQESKIKVNFFASGYCTAHARFVNPKTGKGLTKFYAVWALINHPQMGNILFDAGYNSNFIKSTENWPDRLYRWVTPVNISPKDSAISILASNGLLPQDIHYFVVSHFHADHICALKDFPNAKIIGTDEALQQALQLKGFSAVKKAILKRLIPENILDRWISLDKTCEKITDDKSGLIFYQSDLLGKLRFVYLPGHACGMIGFHFKDEGSNILYATDAAWDRKTFLDKILPSPIVKITFDSWSDFKDTQIKLLKYLENHPDTEILFTHCPVTLQYVKNEI